MSFTFQGQVTLGGTLPLVLSANASALAEAQAKLTGALAAQAQIAISPPTIATQIDALLAAIAALEVAPPGVALDASAIATAIAEIQATISALVGLNAALGQSGVHLYTWAGPAGEAVPGGIPGAGSQQAAFGVYLLTTVPATWSAMQQVFGLS